MARITEDSYRRSRRRSSAVDRLAQRLEVDPRAVRRLARQLDVNLRWLDIASGPDVVSGTPASWEACIALGLDPVTGEPSRGEP